MLSTCATAQLTEHVGGSVARVASPALSLLLFALLFVWIVSRVPKALWKGSVPPPLERPSPWSGESVPVFKPGGVRLVARWCFRTSLFMLVVALLCTLVAILVYRNDASSPGSQAEMVLQSAWVLGIFMTVIVGLGTLVSGIVLLVRWGRPSPGA